MMILSYVNDIVSCLHATHVSRYNGGSVSGTRENMEYTRKHAMFQKIYKNNITIHMYFDKDDAAIMWK